MSEVYPRPGDPIPVILLGNRLFESSVVLPLPAGDVDSSKGEWFFVPAADFKPPSGVILHDEPLGRTRRGGWVGRPHIAERMVRFGGEAPSRSQDDRTADLAQGRAKHRAPRPSNVERCFH